MDHYVRGGGDDARGREVPTLDGELRVDKAIGDVAVLSEQRQLDGTYRVLFARNARLTRAP
jgi:hypothetical protein